MVKSGVTPTMFIHSDDRSVEIKLSLLRRCGIRL
jgi:hypothetical protein